MTGAALGLPPARSRSLAGSRKIVLLGLAAAGAAAFAYLGATSSAPSAGGGAWSLAARFFAAALRPSLVAEGGTGTSLLPKAIAGIRTTVVFAAAGTSLALLLALPLGFLASHAWWEDDRATPMRRAATASARALIAVLRSVHELLWAMLFLSAFGLTTASAVVAIALPYGGTLAKVFSEMIDEAPRDAASALRGTGAAPAQVFLLGLVPRAMPDMAAYAFYRFECGIRSSAVLGFFGFPTLGYYVARSFENLYYGEVWTYLYALFAVIAVADAWSGRLRRRETAV